MNTRINGLAARAVVRHVFLVILCLAWVGASAEEHKDWAMEPLAPNAKGYDCDRTIHLRNVKYDVGITFPFNPASFPNPKFHKNAVCIMDRAENDSQGRHVYRQRFRKLHRSKNCEGKDEKTIGKIERPAFTGQSSCDVEGSRLCIVGVEKDSMSPCGPKFGVRGCAVCREFVHSYELRNIKVPHNDPTKSPK